MQTMNNYLEHFIKYASHIGKTFKHELLVLIGIVISFITPIQGLILIVGSAVVLDTGFALYAALRLKIPIESNLLLNFFVKTFFYMSCIVLGLLISKHMTGGELFDIKLFVPKFLCGAALYIEGVSMNETNIKVGNKSILEMIKDAIKWIKAFKKDINEIKK